MKTIDCADEFMFFCVFYRDLYRCLVCLTSRICEKALLQPRNFSKLFCKQKLWLCVIEISCSYDFFCLLSYCFYDFFISVAYRACCNCPNHINVFFACKIPDITSFAMLNRNWITTKYLKMILFF